MKRCEVCGRRIKSGWKYCHEHRNFVSDNTRTYRDRLRERKHISLLMVLLAFGIGFIITGYLLLKTAFYYPGEAWTFIIMGACLIIAFFIAWRFRSPERVILERKLREKERRKRLVEEVKENRQHF